MLEPLMFFIPSQVAPLPPIAALSPQFLCLRSYVCNFSILAQVCTIYYFFSLFPFILLLKAQACTLTVLMMHRNCCVAAWPPITAGPVVAAEETEARAPARM